MRSEYDGVCDSIRNGQRDQAFRQVQGFSQDQLVEMIDYFIYDLKDEKLALEFSKIYMIRTPR